jgi:hypothetical protein
MKRTLLNLLIDGATALVVFGLIATGLVIRFALPPGSGSVRALWGLGRHDWGDVHFWMAAATAALLVIHVALHWSWVCTTVQHLVVRRGSPPDQPSAWARNLYGAGFLVVLIAIFGGFIWLADSSVVPPRLARPADESGSSESVQERGPSAPAEEEHPGGGRAADGTIRGSMTLSEVAEVTGIPVQTFKTQLGLPATVSGNERLGPLMQQYGFRMSHVRRVIEQNKPAK